jgi:hypothetical protein
MQDRRKDPRRQFTLPVRVNGHDPDGTAWEEMTQSEDACFGGVSFPLKHPTFIGHALHLSLPLPKAFRQYALSDASYRVYGLVRDIYTMPMFVRVGVMFLGKNPPRGFEANPGGRYLLPTDPPPAPKERRGSGRVDVFVNLRLERGNGSQQSETTVTENIGRGGIRVMTSLVVTKGEILFVEDTARTFKLRAEVRNVFTGKDGIPRLNLRFVDGPTPESLILSAGVSPSDL